MTRLRACDLTLAYGGQPVVYRVGLTIPDGKVTVIVGPNACGKSTLLKAMARILRPCSGAVLLDGELIHTLPTKKVARQLGLLPQTPIVPEGMTAEDLVARGRFPHQGVFRQWSAEDEEAVERALVLTETVELRNRPVDELSGGQRQRVWVAMALAQDTPILLLDEPTTHLDIAHQLELLELLASLNATQGRTVVMVLHDLNQAARYAHHLVAMSEGQVVAEGDPGEVVTAETVRKVFGIESVIVIDPIAGTPMVVPVGVAYRARGKEPHET
jgi:iron complex transport system ATP-binding protein